MIPALEALFIAVEPGLAKLLALGIAALVNALTVVPYSIGGVVAEIISGIDKDHPDWDGTQKAQYVRDAVVQYLNNNGVPLPSDAAINATIELGVQALHAGLLTAAQIASMATAKTGAGLGGGGN